MLSEIANKLNSISAKSSLALDELVSNTISWDSYVTNSVTNSMRASFNNWLYSHPYVAWMYNHPLISLVVGLLAAILTIRLLVTIYRAIANTIDRMWLWILRSPWMLLKFLVGWESKPKTANQTTVTSYEVNHNSEQLQSVLERLDQIQHQQQQIIHELAQLKQQPLTMGLKQIKLLEEKTRSK
ncbi:MAG: hypothetical protein AAGE84_24940 [Cyanobacteria bacterium P01_G01_bin.39]